MAVLPSQDAAQDRENALLAAREEAAKQLAAAQEAAAAAAAQLADAQAAAKAEVERLGNDKTELDKQLKVAQVGLISCLTCTDSFFHSSFAAWELDNKQTHTLLGGKQVQQESRACPCTNSLKCTGGRLKPACGW